MKQVFNPYLPLYEYIPDGEPRVFDGRVYIYGSHDLAGGQKYCMGDYVTWSAPVEDLTDWRYEGVIYKRTQDPSNSDDRMDLWAPDVVKGADDRYYMFYCYSFNPEFGVAVSDSPAGPFSFYGHVKYPENVLGGKELQENFPFDPGVLVDDDGRVFLYYGFSPAKPLPAPPIEAFLEMGMSREDAEAQLQAIADTKFSDGAYVVELEQDMLTVKGEPQLMVPGEKISEGSGYEGHAFFEASSMRKVNGKYYFIYSSSVSHELCYATSDHPDRDFKYGGVIVSNGDIGYKGNTRPRAMMGNNHGSIIELNNRWYIFYHRQTHGTESSRQGCAEEITIAGDGSIAQVEMTSCGLNGGPLAGKGKYSAAIACNLMCGENDRKIIYGQSLKDSQPYIFQLTADREEDSEHCIANVFDGVVAGFKYFDCKDVKKIAVEARSYGSGKLSITLDSENAEPVGEISFAGADDGFALYETEVNIPDGIHCLFFGFSGEGKIDFKSFTFEV